MRNNGKIWPRLKLKIGAKPQSTVSQVVNPCLALTGVMCFDESGWLSTTLSEDRENWKRSITNWLQADSKLLNKHLSIYTNIYIYIYTYIHIYIYTHTGNIYHIINISNIWHDYYTYYTSDILHCLLLDLLRRQQTTAVTHPMSATDKLVANSTYNVQGALMGQNRRRS